MCPRNGLCADSLTDLTQAEQKRQNYYQPFLTIDYKKVFCWSDVKSNSRCGVSKQNYYEKIEEEKNGKM